MCYDDNARPPLPEGAAGEATGEDVVLTASDGNRFSAYVARPAGAVRAQMLIYPDVRGLHQFYKELALRFAEQGVAALAMDYFGRTAGLTGRDESFEFWPHVKQLEAATVMADTTAALDYLQARDGAQGGRFIVGFCLGGSLTLYAATQDLGLAGGIAFYAGLGRAWDEGGRTVLQAATDTRTPILGLFGGADQGIPADQVEQLDQNLDTSGVDHDIRMYPGATHSFFDRRAEEFADASADAWKRIFDFIRLPFRHVSLYGECPSRRIPLAPLRSRDFRLLWAGSFVSQAGSQMHVVAGIMAGLPTDAEPVSTRRYRCSPHHSAVVVGTWKRRAGRCYRPAQTDDLVANGDDAVCGSFSPGEHAWDRYDLVDSLSSRRSRRRLQHSACRRVRRSFPTWCHANSCLLP